MSISPVRFGIMGAGGVARGFADDLRLVEGASLVAVASRTAERARAFGERFPGASVHDSYEALVADPAVDVVYVATPHHLHMAHSIMALEAGKHVICEKPFALDGDQAKRIVAVARERRLFCMEAMWMRFFPAVQHAKQLIDQGAIGDPRMLFADFGIANDPVADARFFDPATGGGALLDRGVYPLSLASMLFGAPTGVVSAAGMTGGVDEHSALIVEFAAGRLAVVASSLTTYSRNEAVVCGTAGTLTIPAPFYAPNRVEVRRQGPRVEGGAESVSGGSSLRAVVARAKSNRIGRLALGAVKRVVRRPSVDKFATTGAGYEYEAAEVVARIRAGDLESPVMPLDESVRILEAIDQARSAWR
jgi:predicted dehydrogenase